MDEKKAKRLRFWRRAVLLQLFIIAAVLVGGAVYGYIQLNKVKIVKISKKDEDLGITKKEPLNIQTKLNEVEIEPEVKEEKNKPETPKATPDQNDKPKGQGKEPQSKENKPDDRTERLVKKRGNIRNIALFGIDTGRSKWEATHSDAIMVLSIDETNNTIKLSSIMRDSYVSVDGHGKTKITNAYAFGGPQLAIKTLNKNFDLDIRDFVAVDFAGLGGIIDSLGGVEIDVKENEIKEVNKYMLEVAGIRGEKARAVKKAGLQTLDGNQAVAYARIRAVGNGDFKRTERQQEVLNAIAAKIQEQSRGTYGKMISDLLPYVETSMSKMDIISLGGGMLTSGIACLDWVRFPTNSQCKGKFINKVWYLTFDQSATVEQLHRFIYEGVKP